MKRRHAEYCAQCNPFFNVFIFDYFCVDKGKIMEEHTWFFCFLLGRGRETTLDNFILFYPVNKIHI